MAINCTLPKKNTATTNVAHPGGRRISLLRKNFKAQGYKTSYTIYINDIRAMVTPIKVTTCKGYLEKEKIPSKAKKNRLLYEYLAFPLYRGSTSKFKPVCLKPTQLI